MYSLPMSQRFTDADLRALVSDEVFQPEVVWKLHDLQVNLEFAFNFSVHCPICFVPMVLSQIDVNLIRRLLVELSVFLQQLLNSLMLMEESMLLVQLDQDQ
jgi:hypothetical protein